MTTPADPQAPRTQAGKALLANLCAKWPERGRRRLIRVVKEALPAIEAEAAAAEAQPPL